MRQHEGEDDVAQERTAKQYLPKEAQPSATYYCVACKEMVPIDHACHAKTQAQPVERTRERLMGIIYEGRSNVTLLTDRILRDFTVTPRSTTATGVMANESARRSVTQEELDALAPRETELLGVPPR